MIQPRVCKQCGSPFQGGPRAYYCPICRLARQRQATAEYKARAKREKVRRLGSIDMCERCGKQYIVNASAQRFCSDCTRPHNLEYDRVTGLEHYHEHKEQINPKRNERRRVGMKKCKLCGGEFDPQGTRKVYCSADCRRKGVNKSWMEGYWRRN